MKCFDHFSHSIENRGWAVTPPIVPQSEIESILVSHSAIAEQPLRGGMRNLLDLHFIRDLARSEPVRSVASSILGTDCFAVRGLYFDKNSDANWVVPWHQDLTIAVDRKCETEGFGPWSIKAGVDHVQARRSLLERMLAVRVHLDACRFDNGPLRFIPGSHRLGVIASNEMVSKIDESRAEIATAEAGSILAFRPLLFHASRPAIAPTHRRVIHFEFAAEELPVGLEWRWRV